MRQIVTKLSICFPSMLLAVEMLLSQSIVTTQHGVTFTMYRVSPTLHQLYDKGRNIKTYAINDLGVTYTDDNGLFPLVPKIFLGTPSKKLYLDTYA